MGIFAGILLALACCVWFIWGIIAVGTIWNLIAQYIFVILAVGIFIMLFSSIFNSTNNVLVKTLFLHVLLYFASIIFMALMAVSLSDRNIHGFEAILVIIPLLFFNIPAFSAVSKERWSSSFSIKQEKSLIVAAVIANIILCISSFYPYIIYGANAELWNTLRYSPSILTYICPSIMALLYLMVVYKGVAKYIRLNNE